MTKHLITVFTLLLGANSFASSTVCSGEKLYVSNVRADFGTRPPTGMTTGHHTIVFKGEVLQTYDTVAGLFPQGVPPYQVRHEGEPRVLEETHGGATYRKVYEVTAVLEKVDSLSGKLLEELGREEVLCREIQNFVP